jgi:cytoskeleton protein RodZ
VRGNTAADQEPAEGPGSSLRRAREARGLTAQQAAEQINLDVGVLAALENDDYAALGAPVFARGHLRRYGAYLGLDEGELLGTYERSSVRAQPPTLVPRARIEMAPVRGRPKWPWVLGGAVLFVLAAGLVAYVSEYGLTIPGLSTDRSAGVAVPETSPEAAGSAAVDAGTVAAGTTAVETTAPGVAASGAGATDGVVPPPVPAGHVSVSIRFAADSWTEIYDGSGQAVLYDLGQAGTQRVIAAAAPLSVTFGNAPAVSMVVNGRPTAMPPVPPGQTVARFTIEADGTVR